jgi:O-antigen ligase
MKDFLKPLTSGKGAWETLILAASVLALLSALLSISLEQIFLALALVAGIVLLFQKKRAFAAPAFFWPLLVYVGLSLVATAFSKSIPLSLSDDKGMLIYLAVPILLAAFTRVNEFELPYAALFVSALVSAVYAAGYFLVVFKGTLDTAHRVRAFMSHYMTQGGVCLLFCALALAFVFFKRGKTRIVWAAGFAFGVGALLLTLMRSGWIGIGVALCVLLALWKPKLILLVPVLVVLVYFASPHSVKARILSIFSLQGYSNAERVEYAKAGLKIIKDYPLFGTGPKTVSIVFQDPKYGLSELARRNVHLHSNIIQIAAERGLFALLAWLAFIVTAFVSLIRLLKTRDPALYAAAAGALAALAAFFVAGFMEYNFGDAEVATLLLFIITLPFAMERARECHPERSEGSPFDKGEIATSPHKSEAPRNDNISNDNGSKA